MSKRNTLVLLAFSGCFSAVCVLLLNNAIAAPFGLYYSVVLSGILVNLSLGKQIRNNWDSALYVLGLGLSSLLLCSLAANQVLFYIGVLKPLGKIPEVMSIGLFQLLLLLLYKCWPSNPVQFCKYRLRLADTLFFTASNIVLVLFVLNAIRLNNGGTGILGIVGFLLSIVLIGLIITDKYKTKQGIKIYAFWCIGLALLLGGWLRSNFVSGVDVTLEYQVFELVKNAGHWDINIFKDPFTACLSVSLLPVDLQVFTHIPDAYIFKLIVPFIYSLTIPAVFLITKTTFNYRVASAAAIFILAQPTFVNWYSIPVRQEIAFFFLSLLILTIVKTTRSANLTTKVDLCIFYIFAFCLILSHYSTSYITLAVLFFALLFNAIFSKFKDTNGLGPLTWRSFVVCFIFTFLWYSQLTTGFKGSTDFISKSLSNIGALFSSDSQANGQSASRQFTFKSDTGANSQDFYKFITSKETLSYKKYGPESFYTKNNSNITTYIPSVNNGTKSYPKIDIARELFKDSGKLLIIIGTIIGLLKLIKGKKVYTLYILSLSSFTVLMISIFAPFFSINYDQVRAFQQFLIFLSFTCAIPFFTLKASRSRKRIIAFFYIGYLVLLTQFPLTFTNSLNKSAIFSNSGIQYLNYNVSKADVESAKWLIDNRKEGSQIYSDSFGVNKLRLASSPDISSNISNALFPANITKNSYAYSDSTNTIYGLATDSSASGILNYNYPTSFLSIEKNTVYTNSESKIYK